MPNILQDNIQHKEEEMKDEDFATTHDVLDLPTDLVTTIFENESKGNDICATVSQEVRIILMMHKIYLDSCFCRAIICETFFYFAFVTR